MSRDLVWWVVLAAVVVLSLSCGRRSLPLNDSGVLSAIHEGSSDIHQRAIGDWESSESTMHFFNDHTGSFDTRKCKWEEIDDSSLKTTCEAPLRDDLVRVFTIHSNGEGFVGELEGSESPFYKIDQHQPKTDVSEM